MEKFKQYRQKLAEKLGAIRNEEGADSGEARAKAQGYLEAKQETGIYEEAEAKNIKDREYFLQDRKREKDIEQLRQHWPEWLKECSANPELVDAFQARVSEFKATTGLSPSDSRFFRSDDVLSEVNRYTPKEDVLPESDYDTDKAEQAYKVLLSSVHEAYREMVDSIDLDKLRKNHKSAVAHANQFGENKFSYETIALMGWSSRFGGGPSGAGWEVYKDRKKFREFMERFKKPADVLERQRQKVEEHKRLRETQHKDYVAEQKKEQRKKLEAEIEERKKMLDELK